MFSIWYVCWATELTGINDGPRVRDADPPGDESGSLPQPLSAIEAVMLDACAAEDPWPAQIAAGIYAGIDFIIDNHELVRAWLMEVAVDPDYISQYQRVTERFAGFISARAPADARLPTSTDRALVAGIIGLVADHVRIGRLDRLSELRPEIVQLTLLPYLGFEESQRWANRSAGNDGQPA